MRAHDERLSFRLNPDTGDYCLYARTPPPHNEFNPPEIPRKGFGRHCPHPDEVMAWINKWDTLKHGTRLLKEMDDRNEAIREVYRKKAAEASEEAAEKIEHVMRREGISPVIKSLRPKRETSNIQY